MPKLSDTMEEGTIVEWKKKTGDEVKTGDVLAEVESDKATFDLEAESDGVLSILVEQGVPAKIGAPIAVEFVFAERVMGGNYIEFNINRDEIARSGGVPECTP